MDPLEEMAQALVDLRLVENELNRLRFAGMDQNPLGVRDLLCSSISRLEQVKKALTPDPAACPHCGSLSIRCGCD